MSPQALVSAAPEAAHAEAAALQEIVVASGNRQADVRCSNCKNFVVVDNATLICRASQKSQAVYRCKRCAALRGRIERLREKHGELVESWHDMTTEEQNAFITKYTELAGPNLVAKLQEQVTLRSKVTSKVKFGGQGLWKTEKALDNEYADDPSTLQNIKKNARKFWDAVKEQYLFEDINYTSEFADEETKEREHKVRVHTFDPRDTANASPSAAQSSSGGSSGSSAAASGAGTPPVRAKDAKDRKKNTAAVKKKVQKWLGLVAPPRMELANLIHRCEEDVFAMLIPVYVVASAKEAPGRARLPHIFLAGASASDAGLGIAAPA